MGNSSPRLVDAVGGLLADRIIQISQDDDLFLEYLQEAWDKDGRKITKFFRNVDFIRKIPVLCEEGERCPLKQAYLPLPKLREIRSKYLLANETFPFIKMPQALLCEGDAGSWEFLTKLGVSILDNVKFYLDLLRVVRQQTKNGPPEHPRRILDLYLRIHEICEHAADVQLARRTVRQYFDLFELLYINRAWSKPIKCLRVGPVELETLPLLIPLPECWDTTPVEFQRVDSFYREVLRIRDCSWRDLIEELRKLAGSRNVHFDSVQTIYRELDERLPGLSDNERDEILTLFRNVPLVMAPSMHSDKLWKRVDECSWAPFVNLRGKTDLSQNYSDLYVFFTEWLWVETCGIGEIYNQLLHAQKTTPIETVKKLLFALNSYLPLYGGYVDSSKLLSGSIFPVRSTCKEVSLVSARRQWFIADHFRLERAFVDKTPLLDFSTQEVWILKPLFAWVGLEPRYLSWHTQELTATKLSPGLTPVDDIVSARAQGLLRVATHFKSPRVTDRAGQASLLGVLQQSQVFLTRHWKSGVFLPTELGLIQAKSDYPEVRVHVSSKNVMEIHLPMDEEARRVAMMVSLPRRLYEWMTTHPTSGLIKRADEAAINVVKSILNVSVDSVDLVLRSEGMVEMEGLDALRNHAEYLSKIAGHESWQIQTRPIASSSDEKKSPNPKISRDTPSHIGPRNVQNYVL